MKRVPLTATGLGVAIGSLVLLVITALTGYRELLVLVISGVALLIVAVVLPRLATPLLLERRIADTYVQRGDNAQITLSVTCSRALAPIRLIDQVIDTPVPLSLPSIKALRTVQVTYRTRVNRRGVHQIGPIREERRDPFALAVRSTQHALYDELWVHPVLHRLRGSNETLEDRMQTQAMRSLSDDPLSEFQALREYVVGDDPRRIHWASTARTGKLVVRDLLELRRRERYIVLETLDTAGTEQEFEDAVEIAASLAVSGLESHMQVVVRTRDPEAAGRAAPARHRLELLELFTKVKRVPDDRAIPPQRVINVPRGVAQIMLITGANSPLIPYFCSSPLFRSSVSIVRVSRRPERLKRLPLPSLDVRSAEDFVLAYDGAPAKIRNNRVA